VLCVTHLPQVAAFADRHFVVSKTAEGASATSGVRQVEGEDRIEELAAMLGAAGEASRQAARDLLASAEASRTPAPA
jgi:DNA repair protein RecN (Recombination protein N)